MLVIGFDSSRGFLFYLLHYYYYGGFVSMLKKQILIAVCVVEFTGLRVCKLQFYTVKFTVLF